MPRLGPVAVAATLTLGWLLILTVFVMAFVVPTLTPELFAMAILGLALLQVGTSGWGDIVGARRTVDILASAIRDRR